MDVAREVRVGLDTSSLFGLSLPQGPALLASGRDTRGLAQPDSGHPTGAERLRARGSGLSACRHRGVSGWAPSPRTPAAPPSGASPRSPCQGINSSPGETAAPAPLASGTISRLDGGRTDAERPSRELRAGLRPSRSVATAETGILFNATARGPRARDALPAG